LRDEEKVKAKQAVELPATHNSYENIAETGHKQISPSAKWRWDCACAILFVCGIQDGSAIHGSP
jgi:hypothetical protein